MKIFINLSLISDFLSGLSTLICRWLYLLKKVRPEWRQEEELACSESHKLHRKEEKREERAELILMSSCWLFSTTANRSSSRWFIQYIENWQ